MKMAAIMDFLKFSILHMYKHANFRFSIAGIFLFVLQTLSQVHLFDFLIFDIYFCHLTYFESWTDDIFLKKPQSIRELYFDVRYQIGSLTKAKIVENI